jgi:hypothetical protein
VSEVDSIAALSGKVGGHARWAQVEDRTAATAPARAALYQKFLDQCDGDPVRAEHAWKAHFARLAMKSVMARRTAAREAVDAEAAAAAEVELRRLADLGVPPSTAGGHDAT